MIQLTKKDRLILINQYKILASLDKDDESHYLELIQILENGYSIFYPMIDEWIDRDMSEEDGKFILNILDLYRAIEDVKRVTKNPEILNHRYAFFRGFDGNNETQYMGFCRFLIETQGKFQEQKPYLLKNDNLNSHMPMTGKYREMLSVSEGISDIWNMSPKEVLTILNA
ncbi:MULTISPECIES: YfbU family protein [Pseudomonas]|nr:MULTISPECIES: YfbU family protein [Pseudomonas]AZE77520.1 hypothetical protein C4J99_1721 [Pseudomonas synxantha]AZF46913.1 hypothetical protein C4J86_1664 [Pseudomonas sp. R2-7-07]MBY8927868.1 YfbU family protein [Pseudomonas sp. Wu6]